MLADVTSTHPLGHTALGKQDIAFNKELNGFCTSTFRLSIEQSLLLKKAVLLAVNIS